jgi:hypothetical protein
MGVNNYIIWSSKNMRNYEGIGANSIIGTAQKLLNIIVVDPGFFPGSWFCPILDPGTNKSKRRKGKKFVVLLFLSHIFHKIFTGTENKI